MIGSLGWNRTNDQRINSAFRACLSVTARKAFAAISGSCAPARLTLNHPRLRRYRTNAGQILAASLLSAALAGCSTFTARVDLESHVSGAYVEWYAHDGTWHRVGWPAATVSLGFEPQLSETVAARFGVEHTSLPTTSGDRGEERVYAGIAWRPFAKGAP